MYPTAGSTPSQRKRDFKTIEEALDNAEILSPLPLSLDRELAEYPQTDLGNAERFARRFKNQLLFCAKLGCFYWDGKRWALEGADAFRREAEHATVRAIQNEADALRSDGYTEAAEKLSKWGRISETSGRLMAISDRASSMMTVSLDELDADPMKFNVLNGTLHFEKREVGDYVHLLPHAPADRITRLAPVAYDPTARCDRYDKFLNEVQPFAKDGAGVQRFLHQWAGLSLTGQTGEQKFTFHKGRGRNGKSVWVSSIAHIIGDYAATIRIESLLETGRSASGSQASPDIARLRGVRFLSTSEPGKGEKFAESLIKLLTGEDKISARHLHKDIFEFHPQTKLTMQGNYRPKISGTDDGIWGRVLLVPWTEFIRQEKRDPNLANKLKDEASGILNRVLDGLRDYMGEGLLVPKAVKDATEDYRRDSDPLGRFLENCTKPKQGGQIKASDLHEVYLAWAKASGESAWTPKGLGSALRDRGYRSKKSSNVYWLDFELTVQASDIRTEHHFEGNSDESEAVDYV